MLPIHEILHQLAQHRPLFHSEADFQHALAWELQQRFSDAAIRLERPGVPAHATKPIYVDIWMVLRSMAIAIELKYKTRALTYTHGDEPFRLLNQSAQDSGRYDFIKDIQRVEQLVADGSATAGYATLLTNDSGYWEQHRTGAPVDEQFRLHEGHQLTGSLVWGSTASAGTIRSRERKLTVHQTYQLRWHTYHQLPVERAGTFRFLCIDVAKLPSPVQRTSL